MNRPGRITLLLLLLIAATLHADAPAVLTLRPASYTVGENTLTVAIDNLLDSEQRGSVLIKGTGPEGAKVETRRWLVMPPKARSLCSLKMNLPGFGRYDLKIELYQGQKQPAASTHATIEVPAIRFSPADARVRWIRHKRDGEIVLFVVHDCAFKSEDITIQTPSRTFTDRFDGYQVKVYRWAGER
ncbi:MAG: hypothetical protein GXP25_23015 [Planctomycetes bacterium]|nr:hypothetical protein [Planctomycetota bacterium]